MGGAITHIGIGIAGFLIGKYVFKDWKLGFAFLVGSIIPDLIDFGLLTLYLGYFDYYGHMAHPWFDFLSMLGHTWWHWLLLVGVLGFGSFGAYISKLISLERFKCVLKFLLFFLVGVSLHLLIDILVIETYYWL